MSVEENKLIVREFIEETLNKGNVDAPGDYVADSVVELVPFPWPGNGPGGPEGRSSRDAYSLPGYALDGRGANCRSGQEPKGGLGALRALKAPLENPTYSE